MRGGLLGLLALLVTSSSLVGCTDGGGRITPPDTTSTTVAGFPCPAFERPTSASPTPVLAAGRVRVGAMSYPAAAAPFGPVSNLEYVPFANLLGSQSANVEPGSSTSMGWDAVVTLARMSSGDGAWGGQSGAEVVSQCSLSITWRGIDYHPQVRRDEATEVDGHDAWIRVTDLTFTVPGVRANAEVQTVVIVQVGDASYAYLSYLPNSAPELADTIAATLDGLRVD